jgi:hypothetical protein
VRGLFFCPDAVLFPWMGLTSFPGPEPKHRSLSFLASLRELGPGL